MDYLKRLSDICANAGHRLLIDANEDSGFTHPEIERIRRGVEYIELSQRLDAIALGREGKGQ